MTRGWILVLVLVTPAHADRSVEDWVGTWTGKATWSGCTDDRTEAVSVAVTWRDGGLWLDAAPLHDGLGELAIDARDGALAIDLADLAVTMTRAKKNGGARLALSTPAQCTLTAKLARATTKIAACDDVVALASAAAACGVTLDDDPADEIDAWRAVTGKKAKRAAKQCKARASEIRTQLVSAACLAPDDDPSAEPACNDTWVLSQRLHNCQRLPADLQRSTLQGVAEFRKSLRDLHDRQGAHEVAASKCAETTEILRDIAEAYGCL